MSLDLTDLIQICLFVEVESELVSELLIYVDEVLDIIKQERGRKV